jgi:hypothetical protein
MKEKNVENAVTVNNMDQPQPEFYGDVVREQIRQLTFAIGEATHKRRFDDVRILKENLQELQRELDNLQNQQ